MKLRHEAEAIRNGLLQESFVLRRSLEMSAHQGKFSECGCLERMEQLHGALKELSDRLSPPYIDESLPYAIQHLLKSWQGRYPSLSIRSRLPDDWQNDPYEQRRAILMVLDELLQISLAELPSISAIDLCLEQQNQRASLKIDISYANSSPLNPYSKSPNLNYLRSIFEALASGNCSYRYTDLYMEFHFYWKLLEIEKESIQD